MSERMLLPGSLRTNMQRTREEEINDAQVKGGFAGAFVGAVITLIVCFSIIPWAVHRQAEYEEREKAIKAGVGKYITNEKTGETNFVYGK